MLITRWQAPNKLSREQAQMILEAEGLESFEETLAPQKKVSEHRHPFTEVRIILQGELLYNIAGNQVLLREGDRIEIPANATRICARAARPAFRSTRRRSFSVFRPITERNEKTGGSAGFFVLELWVYSVGSVPGSRLAIFDWRSHWRYSMSFFS